MIGGIEQLTHLGSEHHVVDVRRRFAEVAVSPEPVHFVAVTLRVRRGHNQNKSAPAPFTRPKASQDFTALMARQVDIEEYEGRTRRLRVGIGSLKEPKGFFAIIEFVKLGSDAGARQSSPDQRSVGLIVLDYQDMNRTGNCFLQQRWGIGDQSLFRVRIRLSSGFGTAGETAADSWFEIGTWPTICHMDSESG